MLRQISVSLLLPALAAASFNCNFDISSHHFDLTPLKGIRTTWTSVDTPPTIQNTTIFINLCEDLTWDKEKYPEKDRCEDVCAIKYTQRRDEKNVAQIIPVAGTYPSHPLDANMTLLQSSGSSEVDGVKLELHGKKYIDQQQSAIIELSCDTSIDLGEPHMRSFNEGILRIDWRTKYACPTSKENPPPSKGKDTDPPSEKPSKHWGFLTWLIIIVFLIIAAYVIYSAFLNYSRYGAGTAWDLLPHSDTIRDLPYLIRDFANHVISTLKGGSSRGGYSAV